VREAKCWLLKDADQNHVVARTIGAAYTPQTILTERIAAEMYKNVERGPKEVGCAILIQLN
jgi:hypothetical protein